MARIRTIKPEFWDSPGTGRASLRARLFYIAMWNYADDWGVGDGHPLRLLSFAFPNDETSDVEPRNFRRLAQEVAECFDVVWYEVDGRAYYAIPSWEQHQRTEKKAKRKNPPPDQADSFLYETGSEVPTPDRGNRQDGRGKGEEGNGKREEETTAHPPAARGSDKPSAAQIEEWFGVFWDQYPIKKGKAPAFKAFEKAVKAGTPVADIMAGLAAYRHELGPITNGQTLDGKQIKWAQGWLNDQRWQDEMHQPSATVIDAQWDALMREPVRPCSGGHRWVRDGTCANCEARKETA